MILYHVSETPGIARFDPRPAPASSQLQGYYVWAVDEAHLPNYLLPRDCPRVCFTRGERTTAEDIERFLLHSDGRRVIAVEWLWLERIRSTELYIYRCSSKLFSSFDSNAGYCISPESVVPEACIPVSDILDELKNRHIELRFLYNLWPLHDAVAASTLEFSMIRMRNARARNKFMLHGS